MHKEKRGGKGRKRGINDYGPKRKKNDPIMRERDWSAKII